MGTQPCSDDEAEKRGSGESNHMNQPDHDPNLDLAFERFVALPPETLWAAWTTPELLMPWFCPRPWTTIAGFCLVSFWLLSRRIRAYEVVR